MKNLYENLLQIIPDFPMTHIMFLGDADEGIIDFFNNFANEKRYAFDIVLFNDAKIAQKYTKIDLLSPKYYTNAYKYDVLFLNLFNMPYENLNHVFEKIYASMKNAGGVVMFLPTDLSLDMNEFLQELNFVAVNEIEKTDTKQVIYAKKMHGWGGAR